MKIHKHHVDLRSGIKGICAMRFKRRARHPHNYAKSCEMAAQGIEHGAGWGIDFGNFGWGIMFWTPIWHRGRGPYFTILLGRVRIGRGY